jgi:hypothetical protein
VSHVLSDAFCVLVAILAHERAFKSAPTQKALEHFVVARTCWPRLRYRTALAECRDAGWIDGLTASPLGRVCVLALEVERGAA